MASDASFNSQNHRYRNRQQGSHSQGSPGIPPSSYFSTPPYHRLPATHDTNPQTPITPLDPRFADVAVHSGAWTFPDDFQSRDARDDILSHLASPGLGSTASLAPSSPVSVPHQSEHQSHYPDFYASSNMQPNTGRLSVPSLHLPVDHLQGLMQPSAKRQRMLGGRSRSEYSSNSHVPNADQYVSPIIPPHSDNMDMSLKGFNGQANMPSGFVQNSTLQPALPIKTMQRTASQSSFATRQTDHLSSPRSPMSNSWYCGQCIKHFDKKNEYNKHMQSHAKAFYCDLRACPRDKTSGFTTQNDLDRHKRTVHGIIQKGDKMWCCPAPNCAALGKQWPRWDNFKQHVCRMHAGDWPGGKDEAIEKAQASFFFYDPAREDILQKLPEQSENLFESPTGPGEEPVIHLNDQILENENAFERTLTQIKSDMNTSLLTPTSHPMRRIHRPAPKQRLERRAGKGWADRRPSSPCISIPQLDSCVPSKVDRFRPSKSVINDTPDEAGLLWSHATVAAPEEVFDRAQAYKTEVAEISHTTQLPTAVENEVTLTGAHMDTNFNGNADIDLEADDHVNHAMSLAGRSEEVVQSMHLALALWNDSSKNAEDREREFRTVLTEIFKKSGGRDNVVGNSSAGSRPEQPKKYKCTVKVMENDKEIDCPKSFDKHSELKKHVRRHDRLYGCTDDKCYKRFGSKWEWKRHENKQHEQRPCWRCDIRVGVDSKLCAHVCSNETDFRNHLQTEHSEHKTDYAAIGKRCRIFFKWQGSYWCGFCEKVISNITLPVGNERNNHRFDHIYEHLQSKTDPKKIEDWVNLESCGKTKGELQQPSQQEIDEAEDNDDDESRHEVNDSSRDCGRVYDDSAILYEHQQQNIDDTLSDDGDDIRIMNTFGVPGSQALYGQVNDTERPADGAMYDGTENSYSEMMGEDFDLFGQADVAFG